MDKAKFSCALPSGGALTAEWPQDISVQSLRIAHAMLGATLEMWIDERARRDAGEREFLSWRNPAPHAAQPLVPSPCATVVVGV